MKSLKNILEDFGGAPLVGSDGTIQGSPTEKQVKKMRKKLDQQDEVVYRNEALRLEIVEHSEPVLFQEAEYQGRKVKLNKPIRTSTDEHKKFKVYVKDGDKVKMVRFGHQGGGKNPDKKTMRIKKSNPARRKSFRARHNCDNPGPKTKARYWSCRAW